MKKVIYFGLDCTNVGAIQRMRAFKKHSFEAIGITFRRNRYNTDFVPEWDNIDLGTIEDARYFRRILSMLQAVWRIFRARDKLNNANFYYARNLDMGILAFLARGISRQKTPVVYEVLDVLPPFVENNIRGKLIRFIERWILKRCHLLVTSSPGYIENYFEPIQRYTGNWFLLENRQYPLLTLSQSETQPDPPPSTSLKTKSDRWTIGYFGAVKCVQSWEIIQFIAQELPEKVEFYIKGVPIDLYIDGALRRIPVDEFGKMVEAFPNISYGGAYQHPDDLADMYGQVDFAWCFDFSMEDHSSRWLLPNRLYEGGYFEVPALAAKGFQVGKYIEELSIGWTFDAPYGKNMVQFFDQLTPEEYLRIKERYREIPKSQFVGEEVFQNMCDTILKDIAT
jgi:succinoglycan biosynthesis protein ExoL